METQSLPTKPQQHRFYTGLAALLTLTVLVGFSRTYYLKVFFGTPRLSWLAHLHGAVFTLWALFFAWQTALVALGKVRLHRRAGWIGAGFAGGIVLLGGVMGMHSVHAGYLTGRPNMHILLIDSIIDLALFCLFFGGALLLRRNAELHKRLMILAMVSLFIPATARLPIPEAAIGWAIFALSLPTVIYDAVFLRRAYLINIVGVILINISSPLRFMVADTHAWQDFARWLAG